MTLKFLPILFATLLSSVLLMQCEAPRNNPLDPANPNSPYVSLQGSLKTFSVPRANLEGVRVLWRGSDQAVLSDADGRFRMHNLLPQDGWLVMEKNGYHADSVFIAWNGRREVVLEEFLNAAPQLGELGIFSTVLHRPPFLREFSVTIQASISDADNDIDTVSWKVPGLNIKGDLKYDLDAERYSISFTPSQYNLGDEEIVGYAFSIEVKDKFEQTIEIGQEQISRFITREPLLVSPLIGDPPVAEKPLLVWEAYNPGYPHSYTVEVYRDVAGDLPELIWQKNDIAGGESSVNIDTVLSSGDYLWTLWVIDEFNNRARSRFGSFSVL